MYLGAYHFTGPTADLVAGYDRMRSSFPTRPLFHACVETADGITLFDACPDVASFEAFSTGPRFASAVREAGLPKPTVQRLGEVYATVPAV